MTTPVRTTYHLSADQMAALIATHGVTRMVEVTNDTAKMLVAAFGEDGIPAPLNWHTQQIAGAVLFIQVARNADGRIITTDGERLLCVNAPESARARYTALVDASDAPVRVIMRQETRQETRHGQRGGH